LRDELDSALVTVSSVGIIVAQNKDVITIASHLGNPGCSDEQWYAPVTIPRRAIVDWRIIGRLSRRGEFCPARGPREQDARRDLPA